MNSSLQEKEIVGHLVLLSMLWRTTAICEQKFSLYCHIAPPDCALGHILGPAMARTLRHGTLLVLFKRFMASPRPSPRSFPMGRSSSCADSAGSHLLNSRNTMRLNTTLASCMTTLQRDRVWRQSRLTLRSWKR